MEAAAGRVPEVGDEQDVAIVSLSRELLALHRLYGECAAGILAISDDPNVVDDEDVLQVTRNRYKLVELQRRLTDCYETLLGRREARAARLAPPRPTPLAVVPGLPA